MTPKLTPDRAPLLPFDPAEMDRSGLRLTRAEFARFLGCSKQAVGEWVTAGKITLGADGRLDPRQAVKQLLRNSDPARLRAKVLAPLVRDVGAYQRRIAEIEVRLAAAEERAEFFEAEAAEAPDLRRRAAYLNSFAQNAGDLCDAVLRLVLERERDLRATPDSDAWRALLDEIEGQAADIAELAGAPIEIIRGEGALADPEAAVVEAAAGLAALTRERLNK